MRILTINKGLIVLFMTSIFAFNCYADGLGALIELGRGQAEMQKAYAEETKIFERMKRGIDNGAVQKGQSKEDIGNEYGEPVVMLQEKGREKWVYKPAGSSFFKGIRVNLFFDEKGLLDEIVVLQ